jgi:hypothetical protein
VAHKVVQEINQVECKEIQISDQEVQEECHQIKVVIQMSDQEAQEETPEIYSEILFNRTSEQTNSKDATEYKNKSQSRKT